MLKNENEYKLIFSKNLKHYLELNNKSQQDLVKDLGLSSSTVSNWYTGLKLPRMNKIEMLSNYFGINKSDLLEDSTNKSKSKNSISLEETKLLQIYNKLNQLGKDEAIKRVEELTYINKYIKTDINTTSTSKNELCATLNPSPNITTIDIDKEEKNRERLQDYFTTIAAHNDDLTEEEKIIAEQKVLEALKKANLI